MCTIIFSWQNHSDYSLILAANRDEFYKRPTQPAHWWPESPNIFGGKDLIAGGTWMGVNKNGRFAALTNYRNLDLIDDKAPSRGRVTMDFLEGTMSPGQYLSDLHQSEISYNPYNLLVGDRNSLYYYSNIQKEITELEPGIYGLSNGLLDDPWPKVVQGKAIFETQLKKEDVELNQLMYFLTDKTEAPDDQLPNTGVPYKMEKGLSALFIEMINYGTRCSTGILINDQQIKFNEITYPVGDQKEQVVEETIFLT
ncbi:NRDE family protein [Reichenbachiella ulvae]|uniref:NRDE family protein n=1 Tax=Reichenbachiella ulvae TaxID=2980104 RepID=A0ABT3CV55_9BACT|nr:NRDE family protein [Reichenbachiella ulvae]MCV9387580.1 NRDE family protein [Reichenbachiella ulvae]